MKYPTDIDGSTHQDAAKLAAVLDVVFFVTAEQNDMSDEAKTMGLIMFVAAFARQDRKLFDRLLTSCIASIYAHEAANDRPI